MNGSRHALILAFLAAAISQGSAVGPARAQSTITGACIEEAAGFPLACPGPDVDLAVASASVIDACEFVGDFATLDMSVEILSLAPVRYDIGVWVALDGGDAFLGQCSASYLPIPPGTDLDGQIGDVCGDISSGPALSAPIGSITVACVDSDNDGFLDVNGCASWNNVAGNVCTQPLETAPTSSTKCNCEELVLDPPVPVELVNVQEDNDANQDEVFGDTEDVSAVPATVDYQVTLTNPTTTNLEILDIADDNYDLAGSDCASLIGSTLPGAASLSCTFQGEITDADPPVTDRVTVTVAPLLGSVAGCDSPGECTDSASDISTVAEPSRLLQLAVGALLLPWLAARRSASSGGLRS